MEKMKIILLDVGNTNIKIGLATQGKLEQTTAIPTSSATVESLSFAVKSLEQKNTQNLGLKALVVSSVVPSCDGILRELGAYLGASVFFVPTDLPVPLKNNYERPEEVGADRLVGAFAARSLHPEKEYLIIIDFGTATTFDCVSGSAYLGGLICPGVLSSTRSLSEETAKLPKATLEIESGRLHLGRSTLDSLNQGLVYGFAAMVEGLVQRITAEFNTQPFVLATGGFAPRIAKVCPSIQETRTELLMEGLRLLTLQGRIQGKL